MISILFLATLLLLSILICDTQSVSNVSSSSDIDESLATRWNDTMDFEGCFSDLVNSDSNGDGVVKKDEYLSFIQEYGKRICFTTDELSAQQTGVFNSLACLCATEPGNDDKCCMGNNAQIPTAGAVTSDSSQRTPKQNDLLITVCKFTDETIDGACRPTILDRDNIIVSDAPVTASAGNGLDWWESISIAIAAFYLLC